MLVAARTKLSRGCIALLGGGEADAELIPGRPTGALGRHRRAFRAALLEDPLPEYERLHHGPLAPVGSWWQCGNRSSNHDPGGARYGLGQPLSQLRG